MSSIEKTRDIRSLGEYIEHFKRYNRKVIYKDGTKLDTIGMIESTMFSDDLIFVEVLYRGSNLYKYDLETE